MHVYYKIAKSQVYIRQIKRPSNLSVAILLFVMDVTVHPVISLYIPVLKHVIYVLFQFHIVLLLTEACLYQKKMYEKNAINRHENIK